MLAMLWNGGLAGVRGAVRSVAAEHPGPALDMTAGSGWAWDRTG
jgi:hypothetical protein